MDETEQLQRKMLAAARLRDAPDPAVFDRMRRNLMARIEVEDEEPAWEPPEDDEERAPSRAWVWWSLGAVAAAVLLVTLLAPSLSRQLTTDARDAAMFGHEEESTHGQARDREPAPRKRSGTRQSGAKAGAIEGADVQANDAATLDAPATPEAGSDSELADDQVLPSESAHGPSSSSPREAARRRVGVSQPSAARVAPSSSKGDTGDVTTDVAGEAALLREVQRALSRRDLSGAEAALKRYRKRFPAGALAPEADGAAVIVACRRGAGDATKRARRYLKRHASSPLAARIRAACATESAD